MNEKFFEKKSPVPAILGCIVNIRKLTPLAFQTYIGNIENNEARWEDWFPQ